MPLALVLGGLLAILLLACSNVGNLQLARAFARRRELATRLAIGANRSRIVRQLLTETLLVSVVVSAAALALSYVLPEAILRARGGLTAMRVLPDMTVAAFTLVMCLVATIVTGLVPALRGTRDAADFSAARRGPFETRRAVLRTVLLGAQVALSATLLFGATLLTRGLLHAWSIDPGYSLETVSVVKVTLPPQAYDAPRSTAFRSSCGTPSPRRTSGLWEWRIRCRWSRQPLRLGPPSTGCRRRRAGRPPPLLLCRTVHAAEDARRHRSYVRRPQNGRGRGQRIDGPRVLAGLAGRRAALDRSLANLGSGRRGPRRADGRPRPCRAGDVHTEDVRPDASVPDTERRAPCRARRRAPWRGPPGWRGGHRRRRHESCEHGRREARGFDGAASLVDGVVDRRWGFPER